MSIYRTIQYNLTIHTIHTIVSYDLYVLTIRAYDTKVFVHDTIHIVYYTILTIMITTLLCDTKSFFL